MDRTKSLCDNQLQTQDSYENCLDDITQNRMMRKRYEKKEVAEQNFVASFRPMLSMNAHFYKQRTSRLGTRRIWRLGNAYRSVTTTKISFSMTTSRSPKFCQSQTITYLAQLAPIRCKYIPHSAVTLLKFYLSKQLSCTNYLL